MRIGGTNNAEYVKIHRWVRRSVGFPNFCSRCNIIGKKTGNKRLVWNIQWANKSKKYLKDKSDWIALCRSCHSKYDGINKTIDY